MYKNKHLKITLFFKKFKVFALGLLVFVFVSSCDRTAPENLNPTLTVEDERAIGEAFEGLIRKQTNLFKAIPVSQKPVLYDYLNNVLQQILNLDNVNIKSRDYDWEIIVIDDIRVNTAFTAPGGKIFIYTGLLRYMSDESQLIAMLAHEVYYADRSRRETKESLSPVMERLVATKAEDGIGTKFFLDIASGVADESVAAGVARELYDLPMQEQQVTAADFFSLQAVSNFAYTCDGLARILKEIKDDFQNGSIQSFNWLNIRPPLYEGNGAAFRDRIDELMHNIINDSGCVSEENTILNSENYVNNVLTRI